MVPEEKIGCYLRVHAYLHFTDGTSITPGLTNINHNPKIREWLNEVERQLSSMSDDEMQERPKTLDQIKRSMSQDDNNEHVSDVSDGTNSQMDLDDAHMLLSLADDNQSVDDKDQEELSAHVKRTKLDNLDHAVSDSMSDTNFGWSDYDYVLDVECIIPSDQERILSMLDGWNSRSSKGLPNSTAKLPSAGLPSWSEAVANANTPFAPSKAPQLVKVPCDVECLSSADYVDPTSIDVDPSPGLNALIKKFMKQRNALYTSFIPSNPTCKL
ncbi:hypothetical protein K450DRAFT_244012 [Umbelopsis ramanniana AG]|uniref:Uncharacterized protein n=1 Tax=Umbelopsis ramanniana AG TaxID=1314678 RepID=A0AAD5HEM0_UMBRA|nr:uncharacterized protein K450DRAFT_244012 [Umbelopsis ramanniana AG]KAI8579123.1 hypothetical protein K450DRAFT_244012 [Umbelopsis ramanniana AG]